MPRLIPVRRRALPLLAIIHDEPITMMHRGKPIKGLVQIIDDRPGEGDDTWLLADEDELWPYYEESRPVEESEE